MIKRSKITFFRLPSDGAGSYDMSNELRQLAGEVLGAESSLIEIAMGTDETEKATEAILSAANSDSWICLKNVHLVSSWLPVLDRLLDEITRQKQENGSDSKFRLLMTAEPVSLLPISLLQRCKKIISEVGLR